MTRPTFAPLEPGRANRVIGGLAFLSSRVAAVLDVLVAVDLEPTLSRALRLGSSLFIDLVWTGCPAAVRFLSVVELETVDVLAFGSA